MNKQSIINIIMFMKYVQYYYYSTVFTINFHAISTDEITEIQPIIGNFDVCVEVGTPVGSDATELVNAVTVTLGIDGKAGK